MNKCIRIGITAFKFVIWGGKSAVLQSQITFYRLEIRIVQANKKDPAHIIRTKGIRCSLWRDKQNC